jgi:hypothetical protein
MYTKQKYQSNNAQNNKPKNPDINHQFCGCTVKLAQKLKMFHLQEIYVTRPKRFSEGSL